jgi:hypothetical protein
MNSAAIFFNWSAMSVVAEATAAIAVVASLVYLGKQIRQNSRAVRATIEQESAKLINHSMMTIAASEELSKLYFQGSEDFLSLAPTEKARMLMLLTGITRTFEVIHRQHQTGHVSPELWTGYDFLMKAVIQTDVFTHFWSVRQNTFNVAFKAYVANLDFSDAPAQPSAIFETRRTGDQ